MIESPSAATATVPVRRRGRLGRIAGSDGSSPPQPAMTRAISDEEAKRGTGSTYEPVPRAVQTPLRSRSGEHAAELTAGHVQRLAVDVVRELGAEEEHRAGRLLGLWPGGRAG